MSRGLFVTFEGGEGSGKTSLIARLAEILKGKGYDVVTVREPGGTALSEQVRNWLLHSEIPIAATTELLLFLAARAQHIAEVIAPALMQGKIVLCDRFNDSTVVYQGVARSLGATYVKELCTHVTRGYTPDLTFYLDVAPEIGLKRAEGAFDRIERETIDFHKLVRAGYQNLAAEEPKRIHTIDASSSKEAVCKQALELLEPCLKR